MVAVAATTAAVATQEAVAPQVAAMVAAREMKAVATKAAATSAVARAHQILVSLDKTQAANHGSRSSSVFATTHSRPCSTSLARPARTASMVSVSAATLTSGNPPVTRHQVSHRLVSPTAVIAVVATSAANVQVAALVVVNAALAVARAEVATAEVVVSVAPAVAVAATATDKLFWLFTVQTWLCESFLGRF